MKLSIINGSPRGKKSNSRRIVETWMFNEDVAKDTVYATDVNKNVKEMEKLFDAECYLCIFPLYVDSLPSIVKFVFEEMEKQKNNFTGKKIGFIIHSGFSEASHCRMLERYVKYFAKLMEMECLGVIVMPNSEALQVAPDKFFGKKPQLFKTIGENFKNGEQFDKEIVAKIAGREKLSKVQKLVVKITGSKFYWHSMLKKNGVFEERFAKPYGE